MDKDDYIQQVIEKGDEGSALLAKITAPTLKNSDLVEIIDEGMNGIAVLRIPEDHLVAVHSAGGGNYDTLAYHSKSVVDSLVNQAKQRGFIPIGFSNVIDSREGNPQDLEIIADALVRKANDFKLCILNGENAILGERVNTVANVMGTMISLVPKDSTYNLGTHRDNSGSFAIFDPNGKAVYINSDGIGTKTEFYERAGNYKDGIFDFMAMKIDDASKIGAEVQVISGICEKKGDILFHYIERKMFEISDENGFFGIIDKHDVGDRIKGYNDEAPSYNISGSVVSTIDEERLRNPLKPGEGEYLIAIRGKPNPRSNGITDKRKTMIKLFGDNWHETSEGKKYLKYLAAPSTLLYPVFKELIDEGLATSVYHMSGGAFNGKLARPLAKHGLFVSVDGLFPPDYRELTLAGANFTSAETAYQKWPMGNDGFVTTNNLADTKEVIEKQGLESKPVGQLQKVRGFTGVELIAFNGEVVDYSGK